MTTQYKPQVEFPLLKEYARVFAITPMTIFAFVDTVYCDYLLPDHLVVHENIHLKRQMKIGPDKWVEQYLTDPKFRLNEEVIAYRAQLESIKNREYRNIIRMESAKHLSSALYGNIITNAEALKLLKV